MRILQVIPNVSGGGAERFVVDLCNELSKKHEVILLTLYDEQEDDLFRDQITPDVKKISLGKRPGFDWKTSFKLFKRIKKLAPDVIHSHLRAFNYLMPLLPLLKGISVIHTVHNDAFKECSNKRIRKIRQFLFKSEKVIPIAISEESATSFEKAYKSVKYKLIYNGRKYPLKSEFYNKAIKELSDYKNNETTKVFVNIGRLIPQKNQLMLVEAFNRFVYKEKANAILLIIGGGRKTEESIFIEKKLKQAEQEHAHLHLLSERQNATDYLHEADFLCLSSLYEGMPITLIEAFATMTIPVCTPVGGIPGILSNLDSSLLSAKVDLDDYYTTLRKAYALPEDKQMIYKKMTKRIFEEKFSIGFCVKKYEKVYKNI